MSLSPKNTKRAVASKETGEGGLFESAGMYRIRVLGSIDDAYADQLGGMIITRAFTADQKPMTILIGHMEDQAALSGVLTGLYELHLPLVTVELLSTQ
ncbi:MAG: hypothetical protein ACI8ZB_002070 [Desulforhopalus sp.]|jgi:hypothetical protein